jgi:putative FmdB family regulatory protein
MPVYEYRCDDGHTFEVLQRMSDDPVAECQTCGRPVQRVFHPVAVHFKGSGFYNTDYGKQKRGAGKDDASSGDSSASSPSSSDSGSSSNSGSGSGDSPKKSESSPSKPASASTSSD